MLEVRISDGAPGQEGGPAGEPGAPDGARLKYRLELDVPEDGVAPQDAAVFLGALERALSGKLLGEPSPQRVIGPGADRAPANVVSGVIEVKPRGAPTASREPERPAADLESAILAHLASQEPPRAAAPAAPPPPRQARPAAPPPPAPAPRPPAPAAPRPPVDLEAVLRGADYPEPPKSWWDDDVGFMTDLPTEEWTGRVKRSRARRVVAVVALGVVLIVGAGTAGLAWQGRLPFARADQPARAAAPRVPAAPTASPAPARPRLGFLTLRSDPDGATVSLGGRVVGRTPLTLGDVDTALSHKVEVTATGRLPAVFLVGPGDDWKTEGGSRRLTLKVALQPEPARAARKRR